MKPIKLKKVIDEDKELELRKELEYTIFKYRACIPPPISIYSLLRVGTSLALYNPSPDKAMPLLFDILNSAIKDEIEERERNT